jgi:hypothetical protein
MGCKESTEPEPEKNPLSGKWNLRNILDDVSNYIAGAEGIDGALVRIDLNSDGTGQAYILNGSNMISYSSIWNSSDDQLIIMIESRGEITHTYEIVTGENNGKDDGPTNISLILSGDNQFTGYEDTSLIFYYLKSS